ncbi:hypothetical protein EVAR_7808_1 [Eumeta japonica]|uniref:Uncharacterized protein n=1 Tax=Eumeta variegata TaxID=151549 RepID=A0A4C1TMH6_EUMVA|nr:hypothetical protein EVAR_7808_1 [Eumeta japonica]
MNLRRYLYTFDDVFKAASLFASDIQDLMHAENIDLDVQTTLSLRRISKKSNNENLMNDAACLDSKNFNKINENGILNDALKTLVSIANVDRELLSKELESFANNFNELSKILWDEHICPSQHNQYSDLQSEEEDDEDVLDLDQTAKDAMCFSRSGLDVCRRKLHTMLSHLLSSSFGLRACGQPPGPCRPSSTLDDAIKEFKRNGPRCSIRETVFAAASERRCCLQHQRDSHICSIGDTVLAVSLERRSYLQHQRDGLSCSTRETVQASASERTIFAASLKRRS